MNPAIRENTYRGRETIRIACVVVCACVSATLSPAGIAVAVLPQGAVVGWGEQVIGVDLSVGFVAVAAGAQYSLGLKADGSIVAWGYNSEGQTNVPAPNTGFIAVAAGFSHSLGLKADESIVAWGNNYYAQTNVPAPNSDFVAISAGGFHNLAIRRVTGDADGDGDVDRADFAVFADYLLGPSIDPQLTGWRFFDVDADDDVDLRDFAAWQNVFTGE